MISYPTFIYPSRYSTTLCTYVTHSINVGTIFEKKTNNNWYEIFPHFCITIYLFIDSILFIHDFSVRFSVVKTMMMQRFFILVRDVTCESRFVSMVRETKKNKIENWKSKVIKVLSKTFISDSRWLEFKCSNLLSLILPVGM